MTEKVSMLPDTNRAIWLLGMHKNQFVLHRPGRSEGNILGTKRFKNELLKIYVQREPRHSLHDQAYPVNTCAIFPTLTRLVHQWLLKEIEPSPRKFIHTYRIIPLFEFGVCEAVSKPGCGQSARVDSRMSEPIMWRPHQYV
jgi:hypothetical protein